MVNAAKKEQSSISQYVCTFGIPSAPHTGYSNLNEYFFSRMILRSCFCFHDLIGEISCCPLFHIYFALLNKVMLIDKCICIGFLAYVAF